MKNKSNLKTCANEYWYENVSVTEWFCATIPFHIVPNIQEEYIHETFINTPQTVTDADTNFSVKEDMFVST